MVSDSKLANAVGGKSARACDNCIKKRARWYCAADDAFLCQSCDSSVHSANPLARRHERVRLKTASLNSSDEEPKPRLQISVPTWHQGFTRKARTPRQKKYGANSTNPLHLVPEICSEEQSHEENEEQLLYRVPIFDPFDAVVTNQESTQNFAGRESKATSSGDFGREMKHLQGFLPSEMDLADFAADVESLLGKGLEDESFDMEGLGILNCDEGKLESFDKRVVKVEDEIAVAEENGHRIDLELEMGRETFELNFDYDCEEEVNINKGENYEEGKVMSGCSKGFLKLDYEGVMSAWDDRKLPWTTGERPELNAGDCWPDCLGTSGTMHVYGDMGMMTSVHGHASVMGDAGREARVSRYREKRRTRLFSKKIRYEVRKLNAEKRPRMKGRFVKRPNFVPPAAFQFPP